MKIAHVITSLSADGAQTMLYKLLSSLDRKVYQPEVISLTDLGPMAQKIAALGIPVRGLNMQPSLPSPTSVLRLASWFRRYSPDVIQTWLYHADLIGDSPQNSREVFPDLRVFRGECPWYGTFGMAASIPKVISARPFLPFVLVRPSPNGCPAGSYAAQSHPGRLTRPWATWVTKWS